MQLGMTFTAQNIQRMLFGTLVKLQAQITQNLPIFANFTKRIEKKTNIVIISNGVEQVNQRSQKKSYRNFDESDQQEDNQAHDSSKRHKKHLIKKQKKEDPDYFVKKQKNDRNVVSNIIHHLFKHCSSQETLKKVAQIIKMKNMKLSIEEYQILLDQKSKIYKTYITSKHLKLLWNDQSLPEFCQLMRILSNLFLNNYSFLTILNGNKLNKVSKGIHYKGRRELLQSLQKIVKQR